MNYIWPEILITGELPENWTKESLIADALMGWGLTHVAMAPDKFGYGMALIGRTIGHSVLPEDLYKLADEILQQRSVDTAKEILNQSKT